MELRKYSRMYLKRPVPKGSEGEAVEVSPDISRGRAKAGTPEIPVFRDSHYAVYLVDSSLGRRWGVQ